MVILIKNVKWHVAFFSIPEEVSKIMLNLFDPVHVIVVWLYEPTVKL